MSNESQFGLSKDAPDHVGQRLIGVLLIILGIAYVRLTRDDGDWFISPEKFAVVCYVFTISFYLMYLSKYYREIWKTNFGRARDYIFFDAYAVFLFVVSAVGLWFKPLYWGTFIALNLLVLYFKKARTKQAYVREVNSILTEKYKLTVEQIADDHTIVQKSIPMEIEDKQKLCKALLAISFSRNFLIWGVVMFGGVSTISAMFAKPLITRIVSDEGYTSFHVVNISILVVISIFFVIKIFGGIERLLDQIEAGEYIGLAAVVRPFWR